MTLLSGLATPLTSRYTMDMCVLDQTSYNDGLDIIFCNKTRRIADCHVCICPMRVQASTAQALTERLTDADVSLPGGGRVDTPRRLGVPQLALEDYGSIAQAGISHP